MTIWSDVELDWHLGYFIVTTQGKGGPLYFLDSKISPSGYIDVKFTAFLEEARQFSIGFDAYESARIWTKEREYLLRKLDAKRSDSLPGARPIPRGVCG